VGLIRFKDGNKLGGYFLLLKTLPKINEKLTEEIMMSASTNISSSIIGLLFSFLVKKWFFLEPGGYEPCTLTALSLRQHLNHLFFLNLKLLPSWRETLRLEFYKAGSVPRFWY